MTLLFKITQLPFTAPDFIFHWSNKKKAFVGKTGAMMSTSLEKQEGKSLSKTDFQEEKIKMHFKSTA